MENKKILTWGSVAKVAAGLYVLNLVTKNNGKDTKDTVLKTRNGHVPYGPEFGGL